MSIAFNRELALEAALLLLHDLHRDEVLEVGVVRGKVVTDVLIRLRNPCRCKPISRLVRWVDECCCYLQTVEWSYCLLSKWRRQIFRITPSCS